MINRTPSQAANIAAAFACALIALTTSTWTLPNESAIVVVVITALIGFLTHLKVRGATAAMLCGLLGIACTRLTLSLVR